MSSTINNVSIATSSPLVFSEISPNITHKLHAFLNGTNPLTGSELISLLKQDPMLSHLYSLSAGVGEGYTIEEHIHMVVDSFANEFAEQPDVKSILKRTNLSPQQFLLFLALHDIGKGRAVQEIYFATPERKELELKYTREEVRRICSQDLIPVFEALLADDSIGDLMKIGQPTEADLQKTAQSIEASANFCNLRADDFLDLKILFHKVDAASYHFVRTRFFKHNQNEIIMLGNQAFPRYVGYSDANESKAMQLRSMLSVPSPSSQVEKLSGEEFLSLFKGSVWDYSLAEIGNLEGALMQVRRSEGKESDRYIQLKKRVMEVRMARLPLRAYEMWKRGNAELNSNYFQSLHPKNKQNRNQIKNQMISQCQLSNDEERLKLLSRITFIHGSSSAALAMMLLLPEPSLLWTGALLSTGVAPMYGELDRGVDPWGVNQRSLSAETIRNIERILNYTKMNPFNPEKFSSLQNPFRLIQLDNYSLPDFIHSLKKWKAEHPEEFAHELSPGTRKCNLLIEAIDFLISQKQNEQESYQFVLSNHPSEAPKFFSYELTKLQELIPQLQTLSTQLANGEELSVSGDLESDYRFHRILEQIRHPYSLLSKENTWTGCAVQVMQLKQWNPQLFKDTILPVQNEWLASLEKERIQQEKPLRQMLAMIDHTFTEEEITFILNQRKESSSNNFSLDEMPQSLQSIFPTPKDIPENSAWGCNFDFNSVQRELWLYREGHYRWGPLMKTVLNNRLSGNNLDVYKPLFEMELDRIERGFTHISMALSDMPAVVQIPQDESVRSLITQPIPIIFSSTTIQPKPISADPNPSEYILDAPAKLGKGGCDILFTDSEESKQRILAVLPEHLQEEIEIHLFDELKVDNLPLIHAPNQISPL